MQEEVIYRPNYYFLESLLAIKMRRIHIVMNKPFYLEINKVLMYEFWYDCERPKYREKFKLPCINTGSFII